ncbi:LysM peptidoglycan-binding domain-containing protein [Paenarthrobacter nitroguajacolicus]|uniref:LysM peptidoglycan-binding domain-containing protein n=1 Tax=Paenarthrobacter nitroguajacolicus TaxID=211146 RepID=UPI00248C688C|nr:LysM domain-containing protein [Paenarthrobacter nitroguajacolicus]MDI2035035.1 hypothetical protein [Paenarthrobacter nitroguajacolicus]
MARSFRRDTGLAATILALGLILALVGNTLVGQWQNAQRHHQSFPFDQLAGFAASAMGTAVVAWWVLSLVMAFLSAILHRAGARNGADIFSRFSPAFMVRLAIAVLGMNLLGGGLAQASAAPTPEWFPTSAHSGVVLAASVPASKSGAGSALNTIADGNNIETSAHDPSWQPRPPVVGPGLLSRPGSRDATAATGNGVEVKAGDTLWSIAAARLGPFSTDVDVADAWPKWYAANRSVIGDNPAVLRPGQILQPPEPA